MHLCTTVCITLHTTYRMYFTVPNDGSYSYSYSYSYNYVHIPGYIHTYIPSSPPSCILHSFYCMLLSCKLLPSILQKSTTTKH
jgi:hypothetical protein